MTVDEAIKHAEEVAESQEYEGKKLEESGKKYHDEYENYCASQCFECATEHRQLAEWLKELKQLKEQTGWIPVSERLPKRENSEQLRGWYLTTNAYGSVEVTKYEFENGSFGFIGWGSDIRIVAWMPLPQVYKLESEG